MGATTDDRRREIADHLIHQAAVYCPSAAGRPTVRCLQSVQRTSWIHFFELVCGPARRSIVAKCSHVYPHNHEGWTELKHFQRLNAVASPGHFGCPNPLGVIPGLDVLLTERVDGIDLWTWLVRGRGGAARRVAQARQIGDQCGQWLRVLHDLAPRRAGDLDQPGFDALVSPVRAAFGLDAVQDRAADSLLTDRQRRTLAVTLDAIRRRFDVIKLDYRPQHGDFAGRNILVTGEGVIVLDMTQNREAPTVADIAYFGVALRLLVAQYRRPAMIQAILLDAFQAGYHHPAGAVDLDPLALRLYELVALARYAVRHQQRLAALPRPVALVACWQLRRAYTRVVGGLLGAIQSDLHIPSVRLV